MLNEIIKSLSFAFNKVFTDFKGIYVFGECADGKIHEDEDIEIAAIFETEDKSKRQQIWPIVGKIETEKGVCIDLYPYTEDSFKQDEDIYNEVMANNIFYNNKGVQTK